MYHLRGKTFFFCSIATFWVVRNNNISVSKCLSLSSFSLRFTQLEVRARLKCLCKSQLIILQKKMISTLKFLCKKKGRNHSQAKLFLDPAVREICFVWLKCPENSKVSHDGLRLHTEIFNYNGKLGRLHSFQNHKLGAQLTQHTRSRKKERKTRKERGVRWHLCTRMI